MEKIRSLYDVVRQDNRPLLAAGFANEQLVSEVTQAISSSLFNAGKVIDRSNGFYGNKINTTILCNTLINTMAGIADPDAAMSSICVTAIFDPEKFEDILVKLMHGSIMAGIAIAVEAELR